MPESNIKNILVTGGAGFIGSNTLIYLFNKYPDYKFVVLDALTYAGDIKSIPEDIRKSPRFEFCYGDIRNVRVVDKLVGESDIIIHFAAESHVSRSIHDDAIFFETDVIGTQRLMSAVLQNLNRIDRFIHMSTSEVYGTALSQFMDESHPLNPQSPYAAAKVGADRLVAAYYATYKVPAVIVRSFNVFGPRQHLEKLFPRFITSVLLNEPLTIHGTGDSKRDFTYVEDTAKAIDVIMHAPREKVIGQVFNIGTGESLSIKDVAHMVLAEMVSGGSETSPEIRYASHAVNVGDRPGQVFRHTADARKIKAALGWEPEVSLKDGIHRTVEWYKQNRDWWEHKVWMRHVPVITEGGKIEFH